MSDSLEYWMGELANKAPGTRARYREYFQKFCAFVGKTADEVLAQRKGDLKAGEISEQRSLETQLKGFIADLRGKGYSTGTTQIAFAAVRSFFEMHYLPLRMRRGDYPSGESLGSRAATKDIIKKILSDAKKFKDPVKIRALIFFLKDTGFRVSDAGQFTYGDIAEGLEKGDSFIAIARITQKQKTTAKTFIGPEAVQAIKDYLEERRKGTRRIPAETITKKSPLFRVSQNGSVRRISRGGLSSLLAFHCKRIGEPDLSAHSFRKYFQTQLEAAGVHPNWIDQMIGHRLINSRDAYSLPTEEQLREAYEKAYSQLRVYPDKTEVEERISKLEEQVTERNGTIADLLTNGTHKINEMNDMKKHMESLQEQVNMMARMLTAAHDGKAQPVQLRDHPEVPVWKMNDADASEALGVPIENIKKAKQKLREIAEQKAKPK